LQFDLRRFAKNISTLKKIFLNKRRARVRAYVYGRVYR
jgi:hypothetical protein